MLKDNGSLKAYFVFFEEVRPKYASHRSFALKCSERITATLEPLPFIHYFSLCYDVFFKIHVVYKSMSVIDEIYATEKEEAREGKS